MSTPIKDRFDEELNRTIAEWMGWKLIPSHDIYISGQLQAVPEEWESSNGDYHDELPNYCRDLNACHEAEGKILEDADTGYAYDCELNVVCKVFEDGILTFKNMWHATARQRAEALVAVIESQQKQQS